MPRMTDEEVARLRQQDRAATKEETAAALDRMAEDRAEIARLAAENKRLLDNEHQRKAPSARPKPGARR